MSIEDPVELKNWKRERVLGSGGFGTVTLWREKNGNQMIALKKCRCGADSLLNSKQKERWRKEVEIMQRLNHPNVVRALPLPEDLEKLPSVLPILCMEYCSKGDLRQLLNRPENSCGLQENDVRKLIQNVSSAVSYLHSEKITHRDLKPENIVLAQNDSGIIYKLIDLGYAKELDQSSCTSFVGTLQYLAPELFTNEKYSSSVDYWSLGLVSHEVITGLRPFLPNMAPVAWMKYVKQKSKDHICAYQTEHGKIEFSSHLFPQNHISSVLKKDIEDWLKLVLEWDPKKRGKNANGEVIVFNEIESVLAKKVVRVFCMVTYVRLSYAVEDTTPLSLLREWIENDTKVPAGEQELVLASGQQIDSNGFLAQCFNGTSQESLFVFKKGELVIPVVSPNFPPLVANILQSPQEKLEYVFQRRAYSHAVFFLQQESKLYKTFLMGCKLKLLSVVLQCQKVVRESQKITDQSNAITALRELCVDAHKFDTTQAQRAKLSSKTDVIYWQRQMDILNNKYSDLLSKTQILTLETQKVTKLARKLQSAQPSNTKEDPVLNSSLETGLNLLDRLRRRPASERSALLDSKDMARVVYHFLKQRDVLLHDQDQTNHLKQLMDCESDLVKLLPKLEDLSHRLSVLKLEIMTTNRERQRSVWDLLKSSLADFAYSPGGSPSPSIPNFPLSSPHDRSHPPYLSHSSRNLYSEDHPPPVPPHGLSHFTTASSLSLFNPSSPAISQSSLNQPSQPVFDVSSLQHQLGQINLSNGNDSGIASGWAKAKGSTFSLAKHSVDPDMTMSMINENKSLRIQTQELLEDCNRFRKAVNEDDSSLDWSFLKADTS